MNTNKTQYQTDDLRIVKETEVHSPSTLLADYPLSDKSAETVYMARKITHDILHDADDRLLVVVGPCSVHDSKAALEYAERLAKLREELSDDLHIVMRVYFEKPRTSIGWKGLINDPDLSGKFDINKGLRVARSLLKDLAERGMPTATEFLDLISPQYIADLISWGAIGARTTESQGHRELASGLSCPIGFKNGTYGNLDIAINAIKASSNSHHFMSLTKAGHSAIYTTKGNEDCHIILRGGRRPNYDEVSVQEALTQLENANLPKKLMVDFSHANSNKDFNNQSNVATNIASQIARGEQGICGVMIESHLVEGNQNGEGKKLEELVYGQSITDACISWETTETVLRELAGAVAERRQKA